MNVEADKFQGQWSSLRVLHPVQALLIVGVVVQAEGRRLNGPISSNDRCFATLSVPNAETFPRVAETRLQVQVQVTPGRHDHRRVVVQLAR